MEDVCNETRPLAKNVFALIYSEKYFHLNAFS